MNFVVEQIWRYPVKSIGGERMESARADGDGVEGDRVWAVQDAAGKLGSGKNSSRFTRIFGLLGLTARYEDLAEPPLVTGGDGTDYPVATGAADEFLRQLAGKRVWVRRDTGIMHFDGVPVTLVGTATLDWLAAQVPEVQVEARRLRPNLVVRTSEPFEEEAWLARPLRIGTAEVVFEMVLPRCVMVGMGQPGLARSNAVLKRIGARIDNPLGMAIGGHVTRAGTIGVGDPVHPG
ncbi:MAG TPA: MOSC N-terminal beta barrel domain-containing protein [Streptosporangiaceae bacterium]